MPSGQVHAAISIVAAGGLYLAAGQLGQPAPLPLALAGGCLAGILITPDLDVDARVRSHRLVRENAGMIAYLVWRSLWLPYAQLIPHRSWVSHAPVIGTILRLVYLVFMTGLVLMALGLSVEPGSLPGWWIWAASGLAVSDALHWAADVSASRVKRMVRIM
jgi:uncharacterized metal-binding protein